MMFGDKVNGAFSCKLTTLMQELNAVSEKLRRTQSILYRNMKGEVLDTKPAPSEIESFWYLERRYEV